MADQVRRILIKVDTSGDKTLNGIKNQFKELNKSVKDVGSTIGSFKSAMTSLFAASIFGVGIKQVIDLFDNMQKLNDRLINTEGSAEKAAQTLSKLRDVANSTNTGVEDIATIYARLSLALSDVGVSTNGLLGLTQALQNSFRLSGATASEATAATIQLSQGLASGQLRGQELRSVLEQNAVIGDILAKQFKINRGELIKFAEAGKITSREVLIAMAENFYDLDERAKNLKPTVGEALTKAFNDLKISANELNKEWQITEKLTGAIAFTAANLKEVLIGLFAVVGGVAIWVKWGAIVLKVGLWMEYLAGFVIILKLAAVALAAALGPITIIVGALVLLIIQLVHKSVGWIAVFEKITHNLLNVFPKAANLFLGFLTSASDWLKEMGLNLAASGLDKVVQYLSNLRSGVKETTKEMDIYNSSQRRYKEGMNDFGAALARDAAALTAAKKEKRNYKKELEELNKRYNDGEISVSKYNEQLLTLTKLLYSGKSPALLFKKTDEVLRGNLSRSFEDGAITVTKYREEIQKLDMEKLNRDLKTGAITLAEYHKQMTEMTSEFKADSAIYTGINNYIESSGTLAQNIAKNVTLVFNTLEDTLVEFVKTGKFEFKKFAQAVLDDLARIIIRAAVIQPLAKGILGSVTTNAAGAYDANTNSSGVGDAKLAERYAMGGAFKGGVQYFATGGIVSGATAFGMRNGIGVMGEAGPEAIMPLTRGSDGKLGVQATTAPVIVNVINNSGAEATTTETAGPNGERVIQVMIEGKVKEMFGRGAMDKTMNQLYGMNRRGN